MKQQPIQDRPGLSVVQPPPALPGGEFDDPLPVELPRPQVELTAEERKVWLYVGKALRDAGLIHRTDAITLTVIVRTFCSWIDIERSLTEYKAAHGSLVKSTEKGYPVMHPLFYAAQTEKKALLQWLPEASLTIPSYQKAMAAIDLDGQADLFEQGVDELAQHARSKPRLA